MEKGGSTLVEKLREAPFIAAAGKGKGSYGHGAGKGGSDFGGERRRKVLTTERSGGRYRVITEKEAGTNRNRRDLEKKKRLGGGRLSRVGTVRR